jgi:subtilisin family serine protease
MYSHLQNRGPGHITHQLLSTPNKKGGHYREFECSDVFSGLVVETDSENVDSLLEMEGVVNVWAMSTISTPRLEKSPDLSSTVIGRNYSLHRWTGVDKLHAKGIRGKGATVAIIDTGINYNHKAVLLTRLMFI